MRRRARRLALAELPRLAAARASHVRCKRPPAGGAAGLERLRAASAAAAARADGGGGGGGGGGGLVPIVHGGQVRGRHKLAYSTATSSHVFERVGECVVDEARAGSPMRAAAPAAPEGPPLLLLGAGRGTSTRKDWPGRIP